MEYLSSEKILIVDLASADVSEEELDDDLVQSKIGGAAITKHLYDEYKGDDTVVIGTGLLTGTLYPASGAGVITAKSPLFGKVSHCPITLKVGTEIKYSGFDYIVIKGKSKKPVYLWIHDGVADITDASDIWGKDVWESTDALRKLVGDDLLQTLMIGKAGETGSDFAQICFNYWNSPDRFGFGKIFGKKNLKGLAFRGMGLLEIADAEEFVENSLELLDKIKTESFMKKTGVGDICEAIGEKDVTEWLKPIVHRHTADFNTPYATNTFAFLDEDPKKREETKVKEPGVLITDIYGLLGFKKLGLSAQDSCRMLKSCAKYGIDPVAVAELSAKAGKKTVAEIEGSFANLKGAVSIPGKGVFSPWCPQMPIFNDFGQSASSYAQWWERRQAVAYIFGIQPIFAVMCSYLTEDSMLELANIGTELEISKETLDELVSSF